MMRLTGVRPMKAYKVMPRGRESFIMYAPNIQAASQFVRHWPGVTVRRMVLSYSGPFPAWVTAGWEPKAGHVGMGQPRVWKGQAAQLQNLPRKPLAFGVDSI